MTKNIYIQNQLVEIYKMVPIFSILCHFLKIRFFGSIHSAGKLAMGGLGDHYITIKLNYFVKNIIIYKMAYRKSELYWLKLVFFTKKLYISIFNRIFRHIPRQNPGLGWKGTKYIYIQNQLDEIYKMVPIFSILCHFLKIRFFWVNTFRGKT
jgi:hypothetical protein